MGGESREIREEGRRVTEGGDELEDDGEIMNKTDGRRGERQRERQRIQLYLASRCLMISSYMSVMEQNRTHPVCPRGSACRQLITFGFRHRFLSEK